MLKKELSMSNTKISLIPIAFSFTSFACADPIIGDWNGTSVCQDGNDCFDLPVEEDGYTVTLNLSVDEDLSGTLSQIETYGDESDIDSENLSVENEGGNSYKITLEETSDTMNCTLAGKNLDCEFPTMSLSFAKQ